MGDFTELKIVGRHVPDPGAGPFADAQEAQKAGYDTLNPTSGMYEIGVLLEGAFITLISEKASLVFDKVDQAKAQAQQQQADQQAQAAPPPEQQPQV